MSTDDEGTIRVSRAQLRSVLEDPESLARSVLLARLDGIDTSPMDGPIFVGPDDADDLVAMLDAMGAPREHPTLGRWTLGGRLRAWHAHVGPLITQCAELRVHLLVEGQEDPKPYACGATSGGHSGGRLEGVDCAHCLSGALEGALLELQTLRARSGS